LWAADSEEDDDGVIDAAIDDMPASVLGGNAALWATDSEAEDASRRGIRKNQRLPIAHAMQSVKLC
jgi:hypothetical protein